MLLAHTLPGLGFSLKNINNASCVFMVFGSPCIKQNYKEAHGMLGWSMELDDIIKSK